MKRVLSFVVFFLIIMTTISFSLAKERVKFSKISEEGNLALNINRTGYPHPLDSDRGWGGGSDKWEIVDGIRTYDHWAHGLAFCGGKNQWCGEPCGWRQVTIDFGKEVVANRVVVWHHGREHVPSTFMIQYWHEGKFETIFSTSNGRDFIKNLPSNPEKWWENFSIPVEVEFKPVKTRKLRYLLNNCDIEHGWIYEIEVYNTNVKYAQDFYPKDVSDIEIVPDFKAKERPYDIAIIIGIERYKELPSSDYSSKDAMLVKNYLKALGFADRNIQLLVNEDATKSAIEKSIEAWLPNRVKKQSRVFVYYSGHGAPEPKTGDAYIVPYDGDPNYLEVTGYSVKRLYEKLGKIEAEEVIVVLDSCFSGAGGRSVLAKGARPLVMMTDAPIIRPHMVVVSSSQSNQITASSPELGHGIFSYYFLKAIKDGKSAIADIYQYIKPLVEDEAKRLNINQTPSINPDIDKLKGKFYLK